MQMLFTLRLVHIFSTAFLVGAATFNYFLLRPALRLIPPGHAVVVAQRVGTIFTYLGWTALVLLSLDGLSRLYMLGALNILTDPELYTTSYGRSLGFMILFWFLTALSSTYITFVLRPKLMNKLVITAILALISATSLLHNGLF